MKPLAVATWVLAVSLALSLLAGCNTTPSGPPSPLPSQTTPGPRPSTAQQHPNIIYVLTDDLDAQEFTLFPQLKSLLVDQGTTLANFFVTDSLCCPSRASILRGQLVHNHHVTTNTPPLGGFEKFYQQHLEDSSLGPWMHAAGYRTGLMGKYLNGYPQGARARYVPPGWDEWDSPDGGDPYSEFNYVLNENGTPHAYQAQPQDYMVDVIAQKANTFIRQSGSGPFFLYLGVYAPHQPATPAPRYANAFPGAQQPRVPSFNEADVSTKPVWVRGQSLLDAADIDQIDTLYRLRLQSMLAVQDLVAGLITTLQATGQLDNTYIFFNSDNGFHLGQHRQLPGKTTAYEEDIHVPLVVRGPGVPAGQTRQEFGLNIDLAPTFAALAGAALPAFVDGRSLVPLLHGPPPAGSAWRQAVLVEHAGPPDPKGIIVNPEQQSGPTPPPDPDNDSRYLNLMPTATPGGTPLPERRDRLPVTPPGYTALRTAQYLYVEYVDQEKELYDVPADPYELHNIAATASPKLRAQLAAQLKALAACAGATCRTADSQAIPATP